ncbi:Uncharacterised protein [Shigella sonnei]|nr:Uncharacterised protein [Shigella sonnei]
MSHAAGGVLACEADWLCVYIHVCCADVAPHTAPCARAVPPTAPPSVTDADRPVRVERSTSDGHIQRGSQGQPSQLCIPCIHKVPEAAERVLVPPACGSVLRGFDYRIPFIGRLFMSVSNSRRRAFSALSVWKVSLRMRARSHRSTMRTPFSAFGLSLGLRGRAGIITVP